MTQPATVQAVAPDGRAVPLTPEQADAAFRAGAVGFAPGSRVPVRSATGEVGTVQAEHLEALLSSADQAWHVTSDQDVADAREVRNAGVPESIAAAGFEALGSASLGLLSEPLIRARAAVQGTSVEQARDDARFFTRAAPGSAAAGRVGGLVAPLLFPEIEALTPLRGVSALGRGAEAVGAAGADALRLAPGAARGALTTGARFAAEGAAFGAGGALHDAAATGDYDTLGDQLVAQSGLGALLGGGLGVVGGGVVGAARASMARKALRELAPEAVVDEAVAGTDLAHATAAATDEAGGNTADWLRKLRDERTIKALGAKQVDLQRLGVKPGGGVDIAMVERRIGEIAETAHKTTVDGAPLIGRADSAATIAGKLEKALDAAGERLGAIRDRIYEAAGDAVAPNAQALVKQIEADLDAVRAQGIPSLTKRANKVLSVGWSDGMPVWKGELARLGEASSSANPNALTIRDLTEFRKSLDGLIYPKGTAGGLPPPAPKHAEQLIMARRHIEAEIERASEQAAELSGTTLGEEYQAAKRTFRDLKQAAQMASGWTLRDLGNRLVSPSDYGAGIAGSIMAASKGASEVKTGVVGLLTTVAHNLVRERGSAFVARALDDVMRGTMLTRAADGATRTVDDEVRAAIAGSRKAIPRVESTEAVYSRLAPPVREAASAPAQAVRAIGEALGPVSESAPRIAIAMAQTAMRGAAYLATKLPAQAPPDGTLVFEPRPPTYAEKVTFARAARVVDDPFTALYDLRAGRLTRDSVDALRAVYPKLYEQMRTSVATQLARADKPPPYQARIGLGVLMDIPADPMLTDAMMRAVQETHAQNAKSGDESHAGPMPGVRMESLSLASSSSQKLGG